MAMVLLAVGIESFSVALEGMDLPVFGQVIEETVDSCYAYFWILLRDFMI